MEILLENVDVIFSLRAIHYKSKIEIKQINVRVLINTTVSCYNWL